MQTTATPTPGYEFTTAEQSRDLYQAGLRYQTTHVWTLMPQANAQPVLWLNSGMTPFFEKMGWTAYPAYQLHELLYAIGEPAQRLALGSAFLEAPSVGVTFTFFQSFSEAEAVWYPPNQAAASSYVEPIEGTLVYVLAALIIERYQTTPLPVGSSIPAQPAQP